jgi:DNA-binding transcriptional ArsR family regulator
MAGLDALREYGQEHPEGAELSIDVRSWAQRAGTTHTTVSRFLGRTPLIRIVRRGKGRRSGSVVFIVPHSIRHQLHHSSTRGGDRENKPLRSGAASALSRTLYRLRWSGGSAKARRGVVKGTSRVRQGQTPGRDSVQRIGKSRGAILHAMVECGTDLSRAELAERLGRKPESLRAPLKWLVDAGLLERVRHGRYAVPGDLDRRVDDARELGGEPEADRAQIREHNDQRRKYHNRHKVKPDPAPTEEEMQESRESYPERRREAIAAAITRLFSERPEYRTRRPGQVTCALINCLAPDFPRGPSGVPKDAEVEAILDGVAA